MVYILKSFPRFARPFSSAIFFFSNPGARPWSCDGKRRGTQIVQPNINNMGAMWCKMTSFKWSKRLWRVHYFSNEIYGGRSWRNHKISNNTITWLWYFRTKFLGAIVMKLSIFKEYNHVTYDILKRNLWGRSWRNDRFQNVKSRDIWYFKRNVLELLMYGCKDFIEAILTKMAILKKETSHAWLQNVCTKAILTKMTI